MISVKDAIIFIKNAWNDVTVSTIRNCWANTNLIVKENSFQKTEMEEDISLTNKEKELNNILIKLLPNEDFYASDFLSIAEENEIHGILDDDAIVNLMKPLDQKPTNENLDAHENSDPNDISIKTTSMEEARRALDILKSYFYQNVNCTDFDIANLEYFEKSLREEIPSKKQSTLDTWF